MYLIIFIAKVIENALATLRLIVVANGKKILGSLLNLIISIIWIISTSLVVQNFKDIFNVLAFALGSFLGSYLGSIMETKIGMGSNMLITIVNPNVGKIIQKKLKTKDHQSYLLNGTNEDILLVLVKRRKRSEVLNIIYEIDNEATIISEVAHRLVHKL